MEASETASVLVRARTEFIRLVGEADLGDAEVAVHARTLSPEEAIGTPKRRDFPIIAGKERVIEAAVGGARAHAFTDSPGDFEGTLDDVVALSLDSNRNRAVFIAVLNAALKKMGRIERTLHCKDEDPEKCSREVAAHLREEKGWKSVGLIGLNPAIAESLVRVFGTGNVRITDLDPANVGKDRFGVTVWDGATRTPELVRESDGMLATGTTLVNGTFDGILRTAKEHGRDCIVYGVTAAGVSLLAGLDRICPYGRKD